MFYIEWSIIIVSDEQVEHHSLTSKSKEKEEVAYNVHPATQTEKSWKNFKGTGLYILKINIAIISAQT